MGTVHVNAMILGFAPSDEKTKLLGVESYYDIDTGREGNVKPVFKRSSTEMNRARVQEELVQ
jgi:hypothetical protein